MIVSESTQLFDSIYNPANIKKNIQPVKPRYAKPHIKTPQSEPEQVYSHSSYLVKDINPATSKNYKKYCPPDMNPQKD